MVFVPSDRTMFGAVEARGIRPKLLTIVDTFREGHGGYSGRGEVEPLLQVPGVGKKHSG